jgi:hypothetical protein
MFRTGQNEPCGEKKRGEGGVEGFSYFSFIYIDFIF